MNPLSSVLRFLACTTSSEEIQETQTTETKTEKSEVNTEKTNSLTLISSSEMLRSIESGSSQTIMRPTLGHF